MPEANDVDALNAAFDAENSDWQNSIAESHISNSLSSSDHLSEGDVFTIYGLNGEGAYRVVKIVKLRDDGVHIFVYEKAFAVRPSNFHLDELLTLPAWLNSMNSRDFYYPVSRKLFSLMRPIYLGNRAVLDAELNGYRQWCVTGNDELLGQVICLDDEIDADVRVYARIFFSFSTPTFIAFTFYMLAYGIIDWIPFAFLFGVVFGIIMVILQWASIKRQRKHNLRKTSASSIQFNELEMRMPFEAAFEQGVRAVATINNCKPIAVDRHGGTIEARVPKTLVEEGQEILTVFFKIESELTGCIVWSESPLGVTVDMGKNMSNVNSIISYLKSSTAPKQAISVDVGDNKAATPEKSDTNP